jgi:hypothetical protein
MNIKSQEQKFYSNLILQDTANEFVMDEIRNGNMTGKELLKISQMRPRWNRFKGLAENLIKQGK